MHLRRRSFSAALEARCAPLPSLPHRMWICDHATPPSEDRRCDNRLAPNPGCKEDVVNKRHSKNCFVWFKGKFSVTDINSCNIGQLYFMIWSFLRPWHFSFRKMGHQSLQGICMHMFHASFLTTRWSNVITFYRDFVTHNNWGSAAHSSLPSHKLLSSSITSSSFMESEPQNSG